MLVALGIGLVWIGYTIALWAYCLIKGYDVPFQYLFRPVWPPLGNTTSFQQGGPGH